MMKKIKGLVLTLLLLLPILSAFGFGTHAEAQSENVDLILHKRIIRDVYRDKVEYNNTGEELSPDVISGSSALDGAIFNVYDITDHFYEEIEKMRESTNTEDKRTPAERFADKYSTQKAANDLVKEKNLEVFRSAVTGRDGNEQGQAKFNVPQMKGERYAVYLIIETDVDDEVEFNVDIENFARPLVVMLPILNANNEALDVIHIYPKNIGYLRDPYFFKYGKENEDSPELGVPLEGAVFVLYQKVGTRKLYLDLSSASDLQNNWIESSDPLNDPNVSKFTSDKDGLVTMNGRLLPSGNYFFEEVKGVEGYEIANRSIPVVVPDNWFENGEIEFVTVNGYEMLETIDGKTPQEAYDRVEPRVYNYQTPTDPPVTPGQPSKPGFKLPQTGEAKMAISLLGVLLIVLVAYIWKKRQKAE